MGRDWPDKSPRGDQRYGSLSVAPSPSRRTYGSGTNFRVVAARSLVATRHFLDRRRLPLYQGPLLAEKLLKLPWSPPAAGNRASVSARRMASPCFASQRRF